MADIQISPQQVADKIAAGEVAERPAAVVKELVENAIDAGADNIAVEIQAGGVTYIRVTDNGCGIPKEEAQTAFLRHATSKLRAIEDLEDLVTMGFRGEALASICAVAEVEMITKTRDAEAGTYLKLEHGKPGPCEEAACTEGTTIIVRRLFENVPARMKFLKKDATEAGYVTDLLGRMAFSRPDIAFRYTCDGKEVFSTLGDGQLKNAVLRVYGLEYAKSLIDVDYCEGGLRVSGVLGAPELARGNRTRQTIFVNGRYIKNHVIAKVIEDAYRNAVMVGKFPFFILNIQMEPHFVDVNVHPAKTEVKFANEKQLYDFLYHAARNALYDRQHVPRPLQGETESAEHSERDRASASRGAFAERTLDRREDRVAEKTIAEYLDYTVPAETRPKAAVHAPVEEQSWNRALDILDEALPPQQEPAAGEESVPHIPERGSEAGEEREAEAASRPQPAAQAVQQEIAAESVGGSALPPYRVVGQVFDTYVILERENCMYLVDQHAAHERLRFEKLKEDYRQHRRFGQVLLTPVVVSLDAGEMLAVRENQETLEKLGFRIEEFGSGSVIVREAPAGTEEDQIKSLLTEILDTLREGRSVTLTEREEKLLDMISCKYAIKANRRLTPEEMADLASKLNELEQSGINTCPHGRPIKLAFTEKDLEKMFKRIV